VFYLSLTLACWVDEAIFALLTFEQVTCGSGGSGVEDGGRRCRKRKKLMVPGKKKHGKSSDFCEGSSSKRLEDES
jgi:hypothetical protein